MKSSYARTSSKDALHSQQQSTNWISKHSHTDTLYEKLVLSSALLDSVCDKDKLLYVVEPVHDGTFQINADFYTKIKNKKFVVIENFG